MPSDRIESETSMDAEQKGTGEHESCAQKLEEGKKKKN